GAPGAVRRLVGRLDRRQPDRAPAGHRNLDAARGLLEEERSSFEPEGAREQLEKRARRCRFGAPLPPHTPHAGGLALHHAQPPPPSSPHRREGSSRRAKSLACRRARRGGQSTEAVDGAARRVRRRSWNAPIARSTTPPAARSCPATNSSWLKASFACATARSSCASLALGKSCVGSCGSGGGISWMALRYSWIFE